MDEEITIIDINTRNEKIKNFFKENKKLLISIFIVLVLILVSFYSYQIYKNVHREILANKYNSAVIEYEKGDKSKVTSLMKEVIEDKDSTYSPLGLYFLIDNNLLKDVSQTNRLFDVVINEVNLDKEIKNLIIYKKALFNSNFLNENELIKMLNPIINTESIWKSHALYLVGEYFFSKNETQKAKEFFDKILTLSSSNTEIKLETQKRLNRDFSE
jgi:predicted negative regulator of RcsB-dependent stress response